MGDPILERRYVRQVLAAAERLSEERRQLVAGVRPKGTWLLSAELIRLVAHQPKAAIPISFAAEILDLGQGEVKALVQVLFPTLYLNAESGVVRGVRETLDEIVPHLEDPCPSIEGEPPPDRGQLEGVGPRSEQVRCPKCGERAGYQAGPCGECFWGPAAGALTSDQGKPASPRMKSAAERRGDLYAPRPCKECGKEFAPIGASARYCSMRCRSVVEARARRRAPESARPAGPVVCAYAGCQTEFVPCGPGSARARYCSSECRYRVDLVRRQERRQRALARQGGAA